MASGRERTVFANMWYNNQNPESIFFRLCGKFRAYLETRVPSEALFYGLVFARKKEEERNHISSSSSSSFFAFTRGVVGYRRSAASSASFLPLPPSTFLCPCVSEENMSPRLFLLLLLPPFWVNNDQVFSPYIRANPVRFLFQPLS